MSTHKRIEKIKPYKRQHAEEYGTISSRIVESPARNEAAKGGDSDIVVTDSLVDEQ
ncbi:MAG: hypothetical protein LBD91_05200 [Prevotellaceae bacterium]|jgi:hypothetical protein|nr:hypothetical protein [Prevotellaceae bacterium]